MKSSGKRPNRPRKTIFIQPEDGVLLVNFRFEAGLGVADLAQRAGISRRWLETVEGSPGKSFDEDMFVRLVPHLGPKFRKWLDSRVQRNLGANPKSFQAQQDDRAPSLKLSYEMLPKLEKSPQLRERLSDEDKTLILGAALQQYLAEAAALKRDFEIIHEKELCSGKMRFDWRLFGERFIKKDFENGWFQNDPFLSGIQILRTWVARIVPETSDASFRFPQILQGIQWGLDNVPDFKEPVTRLLFLLKRVETPHFKPVGTQKTVEHWVSRIVEARADLHENNKVPIPKDDVFIYDLCQPLRCKERKEG